MNEPKLKIGDTVYIKKGEIGSGGLYYNKSRGSSSTKIIHVESDTDYPYSLSCSDQRWNEYSLEYVNKPVEFLMDMQNLKDYERMHDRDFGTILKLPTGYVFSKPVTFVPTTVKETL